MQDQADALSLWFAFFPLLNISVYLLGRVIPKIRREDFFIYSPNLIPEGTHGEAVAKSCFIAAPVTIQQRNAVLKQERPHVKTSVVAILEVIENSVDFDSKLTFSRIDLSLLQWQYP
ncbi:MAG TPA: hypothetical protein P5031_07855 [Candidatus Syntrophosphaera sp.]|nr:hypothetical protein [Candidatus Syntrophosphaera sp.]